MWRIIAVAVLLFQLPLFSQSYYDDEDSIGYDDIVKELSKGKSKTTYFYNNPFEMIKFHLSVGFTNSIMNLQNQNISESNLALKGVQAAFGIDLFSPIWRAEGSIINYEDYSSQESNFSINLQEFDFKLVHITEINSIWSYKIAGGLAARYLQLLTTQGTQDFTTPAGSLQFGVLANFGNTFSIGTELSYRRSIISETSDQAALDLNLRFNGKF